MGGGASDASWHEDERIVGTWFDGRDIYETCIIARGSPFSIDLDRLYPNLKIDAVISLSAMFRDYSSSNSDNITEHTSGYIIRYLPTNAWSILFNKKFYSATTKPNYHGYLELESDPDAENNWSTSNQWWIKLQYLKREE